MPEMSDASEAHGYLMLVAGLNDLFIPYAAAGLNNKTDAAGLCRVDAVPEGEEGLAQEDGIFKPGSPLHGTFGGELSERIEAVRLPHAGAEDDHAVVSPIHQGNTVALEILAHNHAEAGEFLLSPGKGLLVTVLKT